ncbi:MAG: hypothetical protein ABI577_07050 [bacterium]
MAPKARTDRLAEIESDLWENSRQPSGSLPVGMEVVLRSVLGIPSDITWRLENARVGARVAGIVIGFALELERIGVWITRRGLPGLTGLLMWLYLGGGVLVVALAPFQSQGQGGMAFVGGWAILAALAIRWGRSRVTRRPVVGFIAVAGGAVPLGLVLMATVVAPFLAVSVVVVEGRRAWRAVGVRRHVIKPSHVRL